MKKRIFSTILIIASLFVLTACGEKAKTSEIFESNASAMNYLSGYWSDGKAEYFKATPNSSLVVDYDFSYPSFSDAELMLIQDGTLYATREDADGELLSAEVLYFEYIDENSFKLTSAVNESSTIMYREDEEIDINNTSDEYVFWSMHRAGPFLEGDWTNKEDNYLSVRLDEEANASLSSNLDIPDCDFVEFANYQLAAINVADNGIFEINPLYEIHILNNNKISIKNLADDTEDLFRRYLSDFSGLDSDELVEAAFWDSTAAVTYLNGRWTSEDGKYFKLTLKDGSVSWNTDLPKENTKSYQFNDNVLLGLTVDKNKETVENEMFKFTPISENELQILDYKDSKTYFFTREITSTSNDK